MTSFYTATVKPGSCFLVVDVIEHELNITLRQYLFWMIRKKSDECFAAFLVFFDWLIQLNSH
jgi:hypothetical protein